MYEKTPPIFFDKPGLTIPELLIYGAPEAPAILAPDRKEITFGELREQVFALAQDLASFGLGKERIAIVMDNGPDLVLALLAAATCGVAVPLNPKYRESDFSFFYEDANVKGIIAVPDTVPEALAAAPSGAVAVHAVTDRSETLRFESMNSEVTGGSLKMPLPHDVTILMYTSGTTKRPKSVPIRHRNVAASATNIVNAYDLTPDDRSLCVMPLFHIHGIVASLLGPLAAGGSVIIPPGFDARTFWGLVEKFHPTWYSAVPTMHQMLLARADRHAEVIHSNPFRFIRSCSSSLPPTVKEKMKTVFGAPVSEAYGMTETAHQIASNPLPPGIRKPGAVGLGIGVEVAIMDEEGTLLPSGVPGEVVARGFNVMDGYENNPEANKEALVGGWLRTGDLGVMDEDEYLTITGRLSERINRGGEKFSPADVDYVLLANPAVAEALAFAVPHEKLGEDIHAAVVLDKPTTEQELRQYCVDHLADFKVPRRIHILEALPYGKTGKPMRAAIAQTLGLKNRRLTMRIAIIGAGSIGGYLAAKLLLSGQQVTVIVRGANLAAINANGLKLRLPDGTQETTTPTLATDDLAAAGPQDVVILGVKAQQLATVAPTLGPLLGPDTAVVPAQNGIPWWYFQRCGGPYDGRRLESVDPGGVISKHIGPERVIGCVTYQAAELVEPGVVQFIEGNRFTLGEPDGEKSERVKALAQALTNAGLKVPIPRDIRTEIWVKVLGNMTFNPISALTRATLGEMIGFELTRNLVADTMAEAQEVATRLGIRIGISIEQRIQGAAEMGSHKTSTLQDIEAGRTTEAECLVGAVAELGRLVQFPTPRIDTLYACLKLLEKTTCG